MVFPSKPSSSSQQQRSRLEDVDIGDDCADCTTMTDLSCDESTAGVVVTTAMTSSGNEHESSGGGASAGMGGVVMTTNAEKRALPMLVVDCKKSASMIVCDERVTEKEDEQCGWGPFRPQCCQVFRNAKVVLFFLCILATIQGMVINGFVSVVISTIEKRFHLASRESGFIASGYDIASVICLIPVSYFGGVGHRPHWIAAGVLLLSLGSFLFAMPHFITDFYTYGELQATDISTCASTWRPPLIANVNTSASEGVDDGAPLDISSTAEHATSNLSGYMFVLVVAQMLHGVGGTPIYTLAVIYLHESLKPEVAPMYLGVFYTTAIIGPAIGYVLGGKLLEIYCDVGSVDMSKIDLTTSDPRWVGAWWIGFLVSGCLSFLVAIPLSAFPKMLPGSSQNKPVTVECEDDERVSVAEPGFRMSVREIPSSLKNLLCNQTFMALNLAGACEGMLISGFIVFTPKFVESQFSITAAWAAQLIGLVTIPSGGGGTFFGGYLVKRLNLRFCGILRLCLVTTGLVLCLTLTLLFRCENIPFVGVNVDYNNHSRLPLNVSLSSTCNTGCNCLSDLYDPVCGSDRLTYFSPCYAGCQSFDDINGLKMYYNCSCVGSPVQGAAVEGTCIADCQLLTMFLVVFACIIFVTFTTSMPALAATLRCVPDKQRSFALGIQWILFRTLGMIPAPILFGTLIDNACIVWQKASSAGEKGACKFYDNWAMGTYLLGLIISCKILSFGFFGLALWRYRPLPGALGITSSTTDSGLSRSEKQPIAKSESNKQLDRTLET